VIGGRRAAMRPPAAGDDPLQPHAFALPFALSSARWRGGRKGEFSALELLGILLCMVFARSARWRSTPRGSRRGCSQPRTAKRQFPPGC
jgi:hypothetical protein